MKYIDKLKYIIEKKKNHLTVGIDPDVTKIPEFFFSQYSEPLQEFCKIIIETTIEKTTAYKFNLAFFEYFGEKGFKALEFSLNLISDKAIKICDGKRCDIPNTCEYYARTYFDKLDFDAITVAPYMGVESVEPFLNRSDKLTYILAVTSNKGASDFQLLNVNNKSKLFEVIIERFINSPFKNIGFVFGASHIDYINYYSENYKSIPLLIPGIGAQGGNLEILLKNLNNNLFLVNVSRAILYPTPPGVSKENYISAVKKSCKDFSNKIFKTT